MTDLQHAQLSIQLGQMDAKIDGLEGKALTAGQKLALLELRADQLESRILLAEAEATGGVEGKIFDGAAS
jgi:hypothetical protein